MSYPDGVQPADVFARMQTNCNSLLCEVRGCLQKIMDPEEFQNVNVLVYEVPYSIPDKGNFKLYEYSELQRFLELVEYIKETGQELMVAMPST